MGQRSEGTYKVAAPKRAYARKYYAENRDAVLAYSREYQARPEIHAKRLEYNRAYRRQNSARLDMAQQEKRHKVREEMVLAYGGRCACCGEDGARFLTIDHIYRDGAKHMRQLVHGHRSPAAVLYDLKRRGWPQDRYRLLCMSCNWTTRFGESCPHEEQYNWAFAAPPCGVGETTLEMVNA